MRPSIVPRLVNDPFGDPGLYLRFVFENRAVLFDAGDIQSLSNRDLLKLSHIFITHAHMDHFIGFDPVLRCFLGRDKQLTVVGPPGFCARLEGKLAAYEWNLVGRFTHAFTLVALEVHPNRILSKTYACGERFAPTAPVVISRRQRHLVCQPAFTVKGDLLEHGIPCLGLCIQEPFHVNIMKNALADLNLSPGPWLQRFKTALFEQQPPDTLLRFTCAGRLYQFRLEELAEKIACITPGQKITYITDTVFHPGNIRRIVALAREADHLFIEAHFRNGHSALAAEKHHLTAGQAGRIAGLAGVKRFTLFHFSPRYIGQEKEIQQEAQEGFLSAGGARAG